jgi:hypothetical protein
MRFRVTIRGEGTELRGYADESVLTRLNQIPPAFAAVVVSVADAGYEPFGQDGAWHEDGEAAVWRGRLRTCAAERDELADKVAALEEELTRALGEERP